MGPAVIGVGVSIPLGLSLGNRSVVLAVVEWGRAFPSVVGPAVIGVGVATPLGLPPRRRHVRVVLPRAARQRDALLRRGRRA